MTADPADQEVRAVILASRCSTAAEVVTNLVERFGPDRAWPVAWVMDELSAAHASRRGRRNRYDRDPAIMAFIRERAELATIAEIAEQGAIAFAPHPFPSTSQVHRLLLSIRREGRERRDRRLERVQGTPD